MIDKKKLIMKINARISEQPTSRIHLGGYHTGTVQAYKNIIGDIQSGVFDCIDEEKNRLQIALCTHESYDKTVAEFHEENTRLQKTLEQIATGNYGAVDCVKFARQALKEGELNE